MNKEDQIKRGECTKKTMDMIYSQGHNTDT